MTKIILIVVGSIVSMVFVVLGIIVTIAVRNYLSARAKLKKDNAIDESVSKAQSSVDSWVSGK